MRSDSLLGRRPPTLVATATLVLLCCAVHFQSINGFSLGAQKISVRAHQAIAVPTASSASYLSLREAPRAALRAARGDDDRVDMQTVPGLKGYYVRPSRAIEKGGGFFVPGLEGGRVRVVSALFLLLLYFVNRTVGAPTLAADTAEGLSEAIGLTSTVLLLLQGVAELIPRPAPAAPTNSFLSVLQKQERAGAGVGAGAGLSAGAVDAAVRAMVKNLPGVNYALVADPSDDRVLYELGPVSSKPSVLTAGGLAAAKASSSFQVWGSIPGGAAASPSALPPSTTEVGLIEDARGLVWVLASSSERGGLAGSKQWIEALVAAPIPPSGNSK
ncbi:hypothetical protein B484DRAFT_451157 [Ochromonadaceae sp. CCMP2298]|nr:hypothetical protein B484DRAFT_451157 [Ochromonadaceae sp. CCMP2298]